MKRNQRIIKKGAAMLLCICLLFTASCGSGEEENRAMGRYVEHQFAFPVENFSQMLQRSDGSIDVYSAADESGSRYKRYNTMDGEKWEEEKVLWTLPADEYFSGITYDKEDNTFLITMQYDDQKIEASVYRAEAGGELKEIEIDWKDSTGAVPDMGLVDGIALTDKGDLLIGLMGAGVGQYGSDGTYKNYFGDSSRGFYGEFATDGEKVYLIDESSGEVLCYSTEDGTLLNTVAFDSSGDSTMIECGAENAVYLYNRNGIFRMNDGGSIWEKIVDGSLNSMTIPSIYFGFLIEGKDGAYYMSGSDGTESKLYKYVYDKDIATLPETELIVYSLYDNTSLRQAAGEFQRSHPDTRVNIQVGMGEESAATESDLIRALNTELLNGEGPDVILLDGMPVESYLEKGVFSDLTGLLADLSADKTMNETVLNTYKTKEGIYAIPTRFSIPTLFTDKSHAGEFSDLESMAAFAKAHADKPLFGNKTPKHLMELLLPSCAPAWINGSEMNKAGLASFLENIKAISDTPAASYPSSEEEEGNSGGYAVGMGTAGVSINKAKKNTEDLYHWAFGRAYATIENLTGKASLTAPILAMRKQGNSTAILQPGQAEGVYIPAGIAAINAKTELKESAEDFLKGLLSESVQSNWQDTGGFPINQDALRNLTEMREDDTYISTRGSSYDENEEMEGVMPAPEEKRLFEELCGLVKTPYRTDRTLAEMIIDEAQGYFTGEKDIEKTIADIEEATKLYLSE